VIEALQLAKQQGKARFVGISTHSGQAQLIPWMVQKGVFDVVLSAFNFSMDPRWSRPSMPPPSPAWAWWR